MNGVAIPGPVRDAHTHLAAGAADLLDLDLRGVATDAELRTALARAARVTPENGWIRGWGWDGTIPQSDVAPGHPAFLARRDGHAAWINPAGRAALALGDGVAVFAEEAFESIRRRLPARTTDERMAALRPRLAELAAFRVVAVDDMVESWAPDVYARLRDRDELPVSIGLWLPDDIADAEADAIRRACPPDDPKLAVRGIKIFLDGTLRARTAALSTPYADEPNTSGALRLDPKAIPERIARWARRGWPVAIHAIGDRAVTLALSALERVPRSPWGDHRIEHAQVVLRSDLARFARAGIVASVQPGHWSDDRPFFSERLGDRDGVIAHPLASLARAGAAMVFGSDWPVSSWDPAAVLAAATDEGRGEEALDPSGALAWYTSGPR